MKTFVFLPEMQNFCFADCNSAIKMLQKQLPGEIFSRGKTSPGRIFIKLNGLFVDNYVADNIYFICKYNIERKKNMRKIQKAVSILLVLVMLMSVMSSFVSAQDEKIKFVVLGDSIAFGTGISKPDENSYGALISEANGYIYENYSIPGHTTDTMMKRLENETVVAGIADADIISVSIGGNNFLLAGMQKMLWDALVKNDYSRFDNIIGELYGKFNGVIDKIKDINPDAALFVQTLYNPRDDIVKDAYQYGIDGLNAQLRKIHTERPNEFTLVEVGEAFNNNTDYIQSDGIHPNELGHYIIAQEYVKVLYEKGFGTASELLSEMPEVKLSFFEKLLRMIKEFFQKIIDFFVI